MRPITEFKGEYHFLSNFYPWPIEFQGKMFPTLEHAYQAAKFTAWPEVVQEILDCPTPGLTKYLAHKHRAKVPPCWFDYVRELVMFSLLMQKFDKESALYDRLCATGPFTELIEGNTWNDTFWGVCNGEGDNVLGRMLMTIRDNQRPQWGV